MSLSTTQHSIKSEIKNCFSLTTPLVASQLIFASTGFMSTLMVAHLSEAALAASVLVNMVWFTLSVLFFGTLNAVSVLVAHQYGAKNKNEITKIMGQAYLLGIAIFIAMLIVLINTPFFLQYSNSTPEVLSLAHAYIKSLIWTVPTYIFIIICQQFLAGIGETKFVLWISLIVVPIEIPWIYVLIFGKLGLPACGIAGIGYGLAVSYTLTATFLISYLLFSKKYRGYQLFSGMNRILFSYQKELIRVGLPMGVMHVIEVGAIAVATFWIGHFGTTALAAHQIVTQFLIFVITIVFAMSQAVTIRVGHEVGRKDRMGVTYAIYVGMVLNFCIMLIVAGALYLFPEFFLRVDLDVANPNNASLVIAAAALLKIIAILILFDNFRIIGFGALRGLKDTNFPMYASFVSFWLIGLSAAYLFAFNFHFKEFGIWWGLTLGIACGAVIIFVRMQYILRRVDLEKIVAVNAS